MDRANEEQKGERGSVGGQTCGVREEVSFRNYGIIDGCGGSETPCNIARYYVMIVHCIVSVLSLVYKIAFFGIQLTNTVSVFRLESSPVVTSFANFHNLLFFLSFTRRI